MTDASKQDSINVNTEPHRLVGAAELLRQLWPEERSRPSLRWLRQMQADGSIPATNVGRRVWFNIDTVRQHLGAELTVQPVDKRTVPCPDTLVDANGALAVLARNGVQRSLRWLRDQQAGRALPYIRLGRRVFFSPAQLQSALCH